MINIHTVIGRLGKAPEIRGEEGHLVAKFSVATERYDRYKKEKETNWVNVVCFGHHAKYARDHAKKGDLVAVCGYQQTVSWLTRGEAKYFTQTIAEEFKILGKLNLDQPGDPPSEDLTYEPPKGDVPF